ncbi:hypothetical protein GCM10008018_13030 [Paenibacillus marchantiophytorum]|uniref:Uncharacterized protein n=1 Tax=Paenibacillus marchantiophytorum TaxID=1619310 RepID=A0ABQ2BR41_9BACL|nr:hypothetical protein [Paenibacillus marchantiophytorum]GGI45612.1 hypothetical protein GCM10008018_13030 [Paenibacillus marchantiophytorum]
MGRQAWRILSAKAGATEAFNNRLLQSDDYVTSKKGKTVHLPNHWTGPVFTAEALENGQVAVQSFTVRVYRQ